MKRNPAGPIYTVVVGTSQAFFLVMGMWGNFLLIPAYFLSPVLCSSYLYAAPVRLTARRGLFHLFILSRMRDLLLRGVTHR